LTADDFSCLLQAHRSIRQYQDRPVDGALIDRVLGDAWAGSSSSGNLNMVSVIKTSGGTVDKVDIWGRRRLAYDILKKSEGIYAVVDFTATSDTAKELDRQLGLNEVVLRTKVMRADA